MQIFKNDWQESSSDWDRYVKGVKFRQIVHGCVTCVQRIELDGIKHYEFFNTQTHQLIKDFNSAQMQDVDDILYFIKNEDKFFKEETE